MDPKYSIATSSSDLAVCEQELGQKTDILLRKLRLNGDPANSVTIALYTPIAPDSRYTYRRAVFVVDDATESNSPDAPSIYWFMVSEEYGDHSTMCFARVDLNGNVETEAGVPLYDLLESLRDQSADRWGCLPPTSL